MTRASIARPADATSPSSATRETAASGDAETLGIDPADLPRHVAIIMDGNRRWAREAGVSEAEGHAAGVEAIRPIVRHAVRRGVSALSLFAFSSENWSRSPEEVSVLLGLLASAIAQETAELREQGARIRFLGRLEELPDDTRTSISEALTATSGGDRLMLNVAFNYSGRHEIVDAARRCLADGLSADQIDEAAIEARLYTVGLPPLDLLIRTGREYRISNFLIWQAAYAEFYFPGILWPDFDRNALVDAVVDYQARNRRFGAADDTPQVD